MERRVEQPDRDRQARHRLEDPLEVLLLERSSFASAARRSSSRRGHDHRADERQPVLGHEHVLRPAEADALGAELARLGRVLGRVRVRAHLAGGAPRPPSRGSSGSRSLICGGTSSTSSRITSPEPPSIVIVSPSASVVPPIVIVRAPRSIVSPSQPATHGFPIPRATTAACEVIPPCAVRTPLAWMSPWMSSGVVSRRTRITSSPASPALLGRVGVEDDLRPSPRRARRSGPSRPARSSPSGRSSGGGAGRAGRPRSARSPPRAR